jgi:hypothetical protein
MTPTLPLLDGMALTTLSAASASAMTDASEMPPAPRAAAATSSGVPCPNCSNRLGTMAMKPCSAKRRANSR